ncbi:MAG: flagellar basal-body rod protein FlgG [Planctomycetales bacterium 12-60-4]|nr:MAG: flagellar basal-body rod protein FlgG [Planctomycetales bacterium 12-60-4]
MLYRAMNSAASGMDAFIFNLDVISNNLANAGTTGFKRSRTDFEDLYYQYLRPPGSSDNKGNILAEGIFTGTGTRVAAVQPDFEQGSLLTTGRKLDVAIEGRGFFRVTESGTAYYTRNGQFDVNSNGTIVLASANRGLILDPPITVPQDATEIAISTDGVVSVLQSGSTQFQQLGTIQLAQFINPEGLLHEGETLYSPTDASGTPLLSTPGDQGLGLLRQSFLEASNTEPVKELVDLIKTQRNVELNSQVVQASDQLLQLVSNLRRF